MEFTAFDHLATGVAALRHDLVVTHWNKRIAQWTSLSQGDAIGHRLDELLPQFSRFDLAATLMELAEHGEVAAARLPDDLMLLGDGSNAGVAMISPLPGLAPAGEGADQEPVALLQIMPLGLLNQPLPESGEFAIFEAPPPENMRAVGQRARDRDRSQAEFLAVVSHELRTPLNAVMGMISLLTGTDPSEGQRRYLDTLEKGAAQLHDVVNNLTDFARLNDSKSPVRRLPLSLYDAIDDAIGEASRRAGGSEVEVELLGRKQLPDHVMGDPDWLRRALVHALSYIMVTTGSGTIRIRASVLSLDTVDIQLRFEIQGTTSKVPDDHLLAMFDPFSSNENLSSQDLGWATLDLSLAQRQVALMGGSIWAENDNSSGWGTTIVMTINTSLLRSKQTSSAANVMPLLGRKILAGGVGPETDQLRSALQSWGVTVRQVDSEAAMIAMLSDEPGLAAAMAVAGADSLSAGTLEQQLETLPTAEIPPVILLAPEDVQQRLRSRDLFREILTLPLDRAAAFKLLTRIVTARPDPQTATGTYRTLDRPQPDESYARRHPLRLLLAEDNDVNQQLALFMLGRLGYVTDVVANGQEAVEAVKAGTYDVVLMDIRMPVMNGLEASRHLRDSLADSECPVIVAVTAGAMEQDQRRCVEAGMDLYLSKPFKVEQLMEVLEAASNQRKQPARVGDASAAPASPAKPAEPAKREESAAPALDRGVLDQLDAVLGPSQLDEQDGVAHLLQLYIDTAVPQLEAINTQLAENDLQTLSRTAHSLKSSSGNLGAMRLSGICAEIERMAAGQQADPGLESGLDRLIKESERVLSEMRQELKARARR